MKTFLCLLAVLAVTIADRREEARLALQNPDLYDGDITGIDGPFDLERNAISSTYYRWPDATVPYVIESSVENIKDLIEKAFKHYHEKTCVKFVPRTNEKDYISIFYGKGCYSNIGRTRGKQMVSLGNACNYLGTVIHELGHALGFYHEQSRSDRDEYLEIFIENVEPGMEFNFKKLSPEQNILYNDFDYFSIMIYGNKAFSKNGKDTMKTKIGYDLWDPYDKDEMTDSDIERVNKMYQCPPK